MIKKSDAILSLRPKAQFRLDGDVLTWTDPELTEPTALEISNEVTRLQAIYDSQDYARSREVEYPTIQECVHAILDDDLTALQVKRQAIKDKYPKE